MTSFCPVELAPSPIAVSRRWRAALWLAVAVGVALRLRRFASDRSLWGDETLLAMNLVIRSWSGLARTLSFAQAAPVGFLWLEKLLVLCFGPGDLVLRTPPVLAGISALLLFRRVAVRWLSPPAALFAVLFLALAEPHVFYSATFKQYSFDVLAAVLLIDRTLAVMASAPTSRREWWLLAAAGAAAQLFSHGVVLAEAAIAGALLQDRWRSASLRERLAPLALGAGWLALFLVLVLPIVRDASRNPYLKAFWAGSYAPPFPSSAADLHWYATHLVGYFSDPLGATPAWLAAACVLLGLFPRSPRAGGRLLLAGPVLVVLAASMAGAYPFATGLDADLGSGRFNWNGRLLLFTTPGIILLAAEGLRTLGERGARTGRVVATVAGAALLAMPALDAARNFRAPPRLQEIGPAVAFLRDRVRPDDVLFVRTNFQPSYRYYARRLGVAHEIEPFDLADADQRGDLRGRVGALPLGRRVWIFCIDGLGEGPEVTPLSVMTAVGRVAAVRDSFEAERVHVWLFEVDGGEAWRRSRGR